MIKLKTITIKNFMSIGAVPQVLELDHIGISLVLGENLDLGGSGAKNGVGKSSILNAISFGLYGQSLHNIRKDNLINKINQKNMIVSIELEEHSHKYRIERGRKPNFLRFFVDDKFVNESNTDEAQGENSETQKEIENILGMSHGLFCQMVALNTFTIPFLALKTGPQRDLIEELMCITLLSQKADKIKELLKEFRMMIDQEEFRIKTIKSSNDRIQNTVIEFQNKIAAWDNRHARTIVELETAIKNITVLDIDIEIENHSQIELVKEITRGLNQITRDHQLKSRHLTQLNMQLNSALSNYKIASEQTCPTCGQGLEDHDHTRVMKELEKNINDLDQQIKQEQNDVSTLQKQLDQLKIAVNDLNNPTTFYPTLTEALNHKNTIEQLERDLYREQNTQNPFSGQADALLNTMQDVSYDKLNELVMDRDHHEFLLKLLINKDSFIRKRIIDQNLAYLNLRLSDYLIRLGLPHRVIFLNDLSTEITLLGQDLDFDSLSRGERTRLILGLSFAFRDVFETTEHSINLVFIDELLDAGIDPVGMELAVEILKRMEREHKKNIFIISHREDLHSRVESVLTVIKENNFSRFEWDYVSIN